MIDTPLKAQQDLQGKYKKGGKHGVSRNRRVISKDPGAIFSHKFQRISRDGNGTRAKRAINARQVGEHKCKNGVIVSRYRTYPRGFA